MQSQAEEELFTRACALAPVAALLNAANTLDNGEIYLVGGSVRDLMLGRDFVDIDVAVEGDPRALADALGHPGSPETRFGTLTVVRDGLRYDLVRTRTESYARPGALPDVEPGDIDADLARRDFTVNAIALALAGPRSGGLIAVSGALADLEARQLAILHDRSFEDDPTRLLRLARYAARLGFEIAPHTRELATRAITDGALQTISGTRIGNELRLLASEPDPVAALEATADLGLPWSLNPERTTAALAALPADGRRDILTLACVFTDQPAKQLGAELDRLGFTAADRAAIAEGATDARGLAERLSQARTSAEIGRVVGSAGVTTVALASALGSPSQSLTWLQDLRHRRLGITGEDLISHGIAEGPSIGRALAAAREAMWDGDAPDRATQLAIALKAAE